MTKQELMETCTAEQLAEMVINSEIVLDMLKCSDSFLKIGLFENPAVAAYESKLSIMQHEKDRLQSEVEKYRKAFEDAKKERDCQIREYQKKIDELNAENSELHCELQAVAAIPEEIPTEPIKVADMIINELYTRDYIRLNISELRQIAEHLLVYCNHHGENN